MVLTIADRTVGMAQADNTGQFETEIDLDGFGVGRHIVVATCGGLSFERPLDVVVTASLGGSAGAAAAAAGAVLCFFVLLALLLTAGRAGDQ